MKQKSFRRGFVYKVRNKRTNRCYVGQQSHFYSKGLEPDAIMGKLYWTSNKTLANEWKEHPEEFEWEVLEDNITDKRYLDWREAELIFYMFNRKVPCYNRMIKLTIAKRKTDEL